MKQVQSHDPMEFKIRPIDVTRVQPSYQDKLERITSILGRLENWKEETISDNMNFLSDSEIKKYNVEDRELLVTDFHGVIHVPLNQHQQDIAEFLTDQNT